MSSKTVTNLLQLTKLSCIRLYSNHRCLPPLIHAPNKCQEPRRSLRRNLRCTNPILFEMYYNHRHPNIFPSTLRAKPSLKERSRLQPSGNDECRPPYPPQKEPKLLQRSGSTKRIPKPHRQPSNVPTMQLLHSCLRFPTPIPNQNKRYVSRPHSQRPYSKTHM